MSETTIEKPTQEQIAAILDAHRKWLRGETTGGSRANLSGADLSRANLSGANLYGANLYGAKDANKIVERRRICPDGEFIGWKELNNGTVAKLRIPADAARVGGLIGRKCRAEYVVVLEGEGESWTTDYARVRYAPGLTVRPHAWDPSPFVECAPGIHFYITRLEEEHS